MIRHPTKKGERIVVPCGRCAACFSTKRSHWSSRIEYEYRYSHDAHFVTLTYDDEHIRQNEHGVYSVFKDDIQKFFKRLRQNSIYGNIRYYLTAEYGSRTMRPHYHAIIFNVGSDPEMVINDIETSWQQGQCHIGTVTGQSISYVTKYCIKMGKIPDKANPTFALMSRRPGLGAKYIDDMKHWHQQSIDRFYIPAMDGKKLSLPRYYKDKIYNDGQKRLHALRMEKRAREDDFTYEKFLKDNPGAKWPDYIKEVNYRALTIKEYYSKKVFNSSQDKDKM